MPKTRQKKSSNTINSDNDNSNIDTNKDIDKENMNDSKVISESNITTTISENQSKNDIKHMIRLSKTFTPTLSQQEQNEFYESNNIKILGDNIPSPAATFEELDLPTQIMEVIHENSWEKPTPIQAVSIPVGLKGNDMIGIAKTGSGKTAAFLIPALCHILIQEPLRENDGPLVLVLSPTRELAQQTDDVCRNFCKKLGLKSACLFGGKERKTQMRVMNLSPQIVIATPGRLIDFIQSGICPVNRVNFIVIDEADRMLDMGFEPQIRTIMAQIPEERQTFMFSATWPKEIRELAHDFLKNPVHMQIGDDELTTNPNIQQKIEKILDAEKTDRCEHLIRENIDKKIIIFVNTKRIADSLKISLRDKGLRVENLHGGKTQLQRDQVLMKFRNCRSGVLIATDVAARGLDVTDINVVINFDFPLAIEDYVHRIGRTARGNKEGLAITFFTDENRSMGNALVKILVQTNQEVPDWLQAISEREPNDKAQQNITKQYMSRNGLGYGSGFLPGVGGYGERLNYYGSFGWGPGGPRDIINTYINPSMLD